jgi:hypothetical protein
MEEETIKKKISDLKNTYSGLLIFAISNLLLFLIFGILATFLVSPFLAKTSIIFVFLFCFFSILFLFVDERRNKLEEKYISRSYKSKI